MIRLRPMPMVCKALIKWLESKRWNKFYSIFLFTTCSICFIVKTKPFVAVFSIVLQPMNGVGVSELLAGTVYHHIAQS